MENQKNIKSHRKIKILPQFTCEISQISLFPKLYGDEFLVKICKDPNHDNDH